MTQWSECRACKRPLRSEEARRTGYGRECARRRGITPIRTPKQRRPAVLAVRPRSDEPIPHIPGQTELPLVFHQPTLGSL